MQAAIFGSAARGTQDIHSDYDVILVLNNDELQEKANHFINIQQHTASNSISVYSMQRINAMLEQGSPFAWHLHLEHKPLAGFECQIFKKRPNKYITYINDIESMIRVQNKSMKSLSLTNSNIIFEMGIQYVCARNIAMFASERLMGSFDFSRESPFFLNPIIYFPISMDQYKILMLARFASTRSADYALKPNWTEILQCGNQLSTWSDDVLHLTRNRGREA